MSGSVNKGIIVAGMHSSSGKTAVTSLVLAAMHKRGLSIQPFKIGPDYIDPGFHAVASGRPCHNIDVWAMREETLGRVLSNLARDTKLVLCEGVMGLFDGARVASGQSSGSTADVARVTGWPVILVIDASAQAASAAAASSVARVRSDVENVIRAVRARTRARRRSPPTA